MKIALGLLLLALSGGVNATLIEIDTNVTINPGNASYIFGDYVFELVDPSSTLFLLVNSPIEDYLVSNSCCAGDFTLSRVDDGFFSLLGIRQAGVGSSDVGGVPISHAGLSVFDNFAFSGQSGVTGVDSILFSPGINSFIQISAFDVVESAATVPVPSVLSLFLVGFVLLWWRSGDNFRISENRFRWNS